MTPKFIPFVTGKRKKIWHNNCLAVGLSAGFIEPLESTAIHLIYKTLIHFIKHFPDAEFDAWNTHSFNQKIDFDYEEIRDFIVLHYCTTNRNDTEFWRWWQAMTPPESLAYKLDEFKHRGQLEHSSNQLFNHDNWCSIFEGMHIRPQKNHPLLSGFNPRQLDQMMVNTTAQIRRKVQEMPTHQDFISAHCAVTSKPHI